MVEGSNIPKGCPALYAVLLSSPPEFNGVGIFNFLMDVYDTITGTKIGETLETSHGIFSDSLAILGKCLSCSLYRSNKCFPEVYFQSQFPNHAGRSYNPSGIVIIPYRLLYVTKPVEIDQEGRLVIYQNTNYV